MALPRFIRRSHRLGNKTPHLFRRGLLHGGGGVGVGVQSKARGVVAQDGGHRLGVHAVLDRQRCVSVPEVMEADALGDTRFFAQGLVEPPHTVGAVHLPGDRGGEHDRGEGVLAPLLDQQIHRLLGEEDRPDAVGRLGRADAHLAPEPPRRLGDGEGLALHVQVAPLKGHQLAPAQPGGQLQIEHSQHAVLLGGSQVVADLFRREDVHLPLFLGRQTAGHGGVVGDDALQHRLVETLAEHGVDAPDGADAETLVGHPLVLFHPALPPGVVVELLEVQGGELVQLDVADAGHHMVLDVALVVRGGGVFDGGFAVVFVPEPAPLGHGVLPGLGHVYLLVFLHGPLQLVLDLALGLAQDAFVDGLSVGGIPARGVLALSAAVLPLADVALAVGALFSHPAHLPGTPP